MKIINREQVSYIQGFKETEGIEYWDGDFVKRVWKDVEYFKFLWFIKTPLKNYEEGYYKDIKERGLPIILLLN